MQKIITTIILSLGILTGLSAQVSLENGDITIYGGSGGSPYSAFGIGDLLPTGFGLQEAFSGTGIGMANAYFVNNTNPASLTSIERPISMIFDLGLNFGMTQTRAEESAPYQPDGSLTNFNLWFRISRLWSSNLGLQAYSKVGYNIVDERYNPSAGGDYSMVYTGKGGVNRIYWGNAWQITPHLSVGGNLNLLFGTIEDAQTFLSDNSLSGFTIKSENHLLGVGWDAGLQYRIPMGKKNLVLGLIYANPINLSSEKTSQLLAVQDTLEQVSIWDEAFRIPKKLGVGFSFKASERLNLAADYTVQPWSEGRLNEDLSLYNTRAFSVGVEFIPNYDKYYGYYQQTLVRAGFRVQDAYLEVDGRQAKQWQASLGIGLPFNRYRNHLNLTYTYMQRGTSSLLETRHQLGLNISLRDVWFVRTKIR
ncbi:MAG: hypothetical protein R2824_29305 [Saprospiraceae bacterium]|nr:hypothetical protein [Lewinella sp.]